MITGRFATLSILQSIPKIAPKDRQRYNTQYLSGLTPATLVSLYSQASQGVIAPINSALQDLLSKQDISGLVSTRVSALTRREMKLSPKPNSDPYVTELCQFVIDNLKQYTDNEPTGSLSDIIEQLALSWYYGLSVNWLNWDTFDDSIIPCGVEHFDERRYRYDIVKKAICLDSDGGGYFGVPINEIDPEQLHIFTIRSNQYTRIENSGSGRAILPVWHYRHSLFLSQLAYAEKFAVPSVIVTHDANPVGNTAYDEDQMAQLQLFTESYMNDCAAILPPGFSANLFGTNAGGEKLFESVDKSTKSQLATEILGQDGTSNGSGGSLAKAQINEITRQDLIESDCVRVSSFFHKILQKFCYINFGDSSIAPDVYFAPSKSDQEFTTIEKLKLAKDLGLPISQNSVYKLLGFEPPKEGELLLGVK